MLGGDDMNATMLSDGTASPSSGILPRAVIELFNFANEREAQCEMEIKLQMFELYCDAVRDLLAPNVDDQTKLKIKLPQFSSTGLVEVDGARSLVGHSAREMLSFIQRGSDMRATSSTEMNADSSRSHLICNLILTLTNRRSGVQQHGKLTLVDLAGSSS